MKYFKKIAVFFLLLTFFYNVLGVYVLVTAQKEQTWVASMENADDSKFQIIELNINPYAYVVDSGFEEVNEDIIIDHTVYHVFKNRIQNNVLKLYCLKNTHQAVVNKKLRDLVDNQLIDTNSNKENPAKKLLKSFEKDYISNDAAVYEFNSEFIPDSISFSFVFKNDLLDGFFTSHYPPPNVA
ncbi:hypothetical protein [Flavobacterium sp. HJJ]|uniref:hypothetical protein n=1 Tax=Flavobacterium sp. HJJ TaxID=2783792 RepID=UPI001889DC16|nr:hypothetical protein [Flavobacterium sp. HJJ]MBF4471626.1 hypothetical protein [Flavobacterium sp. HJJ]